MQHVTSFTMFDSYHVALFTLQTRDFGKIQDGPQCVKWCIAEYYYLMLQLLLGIIIIRIIYSVSTRITGYSNNYNIYC